MYEYHAIANLFPMMNAEQFADLKEDVKQRGLLTPILLFENKILDGRNRYKALIELGLPVIPIQYTGTDPLGDVVSLNLKRRHLNESQRAVIAAAIANVKRGGIRPGQNTFASQTASLQFEVSQADAAKMFNVSTRSIATAKKVEQLATPELMQQVQQGVLSITAAAFIATLDQNVQVTLASKGVEAMEIAAKQIKKAMFEHRSISNREFEWYTPETYTTIVSNFFGGIDLDPSSCAAANTTVKAQRYYTQKEDGLKQVWYGKVFLNPPYCQPELGAFVYKLIEEYTVGNVSEAILLTHHYTSTKWFHDCLLHASALCFTKGRISFITPEHSISAPQHGQIFTYFGKRPTEFAEHFDKVGSTVYTR